ncbi:hypothetical protein ACT6NV_06360 [Robiginitalea sp. IMCC44478]|uniref:hypothetical protein n=1 Tax=Robiginitalea sp. IMCC44478 TaxID=3459122 RepID=UPI0040424059
MRLIILVLIVVLSGLSSFGNSNYEAVYICRGKYSKKYHYDKYCRGLSNCSTDIYRVDREDAKRIGRTLCGWED